MEHLPLFNCRTDLLLGKNNLKKIQKSKILIAGLGGVGSSTIEMLVRSGIQDIIIIDHDKYETSNLNRQNFAFHSTLKRYKVEVVEEKLKDINPKIKIVSISEFLSEENCENLLLKFKPEIIIDCIDTIKNKAELIYNAHRMGIPIISSMGAGAKSNPLLVTTADISKSHTCTLAKTLRKRLHKRGIFKGIQVVFSQEKAQKERFIGKDKDNYNSVQGSISYMTNIFACYMAWLTIEKIISD